MWQGRTWFSYPLSPGSPGHEGWGLIDAVGSDVECLSVGDLVATLSQAAFAEYDVAPAASVVKLPTSFDATPFPGEPLGCAMNILRRSNIQPGQLVAIVGIGFIGAALTMLMSRMGASVVAITRRDFALEMAEKCGAQHVIRMRDGAQTIAEARALSGEQGFMRVIEATGTQDALDVASELAGVRSTLVIAGYHQDGNRSVNMQSWNWRGIDVINAHERDTREYVRGVRDAIAAVERGTLDPSMLLTHEFPITELNDAFSLMESRPDGFLKAWVRVN